jgi:hypothetical protein
MELKSIDRTDRAKAKLYDALSIYRETMLPPEAQNPERQILYWIEHSKENLTDEFRCFVIQRGNEVVGYLQYSFFREEQILFFEYLCIRDRRHKGLVPSEATTSIENYLAENYPPDFTIVFEVAHKRTSSGQWEPDKKLTTYFKRLGFRKLDFDYRYPILQSFDGAISYPADLMVRLPGRRLKITSSEMRTILRCIYFKHYLRWDRPFLNQERFSERERLIDMLYSTEVEQIKKDDTFSTSGDDRRSQRDLFANRQPRIITLLDRIFGPKFPRLAIVVFLLLFAQRFLGSAWLLVPFALAVATFFCLAEDTDNSRKLLVVILSRLRITRPRSL